MRPMRQCALCGHQEGFAVDDLGQLIGPVGENARSKQPLWVHRECAIWSPEAYETGDGHIRGTSKVLRRGRVTWCAGCQKRGATMGCRLDNCPHSFHKYCAREAGCTFYPNQYLIACKDHAHMYSTDLPPAGQTPLSPYSPYPVARGMPSGEPAQAPGGGASGQGIKRPRDTPPEERMRNARRAVKRLRHETRLALAAGSDDEEHFQKKDRARLARDKLRLNPVVLGQRRKPMEGSQDADAATGPALQPTQVDNNVVSEGWAAVGGHAAVIQQLKEMVLLPLQYPEVFNHMGITPPRGILFHGAPGTGKTLVARALAGACSHSSSAPVTLFARKGADCLGKFAGEAERTLRLLFDEATKKAPSIIFLDELDGLVPARSSNSSGGDQVFASVVSTLLALMDGVVDRGAVVVIGATNRLEAIDPALRRPGRFDREVHFGLPSVVDRAAILKVHTSRWQDVPSDALLQRIAASTEGFAGADLQALCTAAVMAAVTRAAPTLIDRLCTTSEGQLCAANQEQLQPNQQQQQQVHAQQPKQMHRQPPPTGSQQQAQPELQGSVEQQHCQHEQENSNDLQQQQQQSLQHHEHEPAVRQQPGQQLADDLPKKLPQKLLEKLKVKAVDWQTALAAAPLPCSARQNLSALSSGHARALPYHLAPLLIPCVIRALGCIAAAQLPWHGPMLTALEAAGEADAEGVTRVQASHGAADGLARRGRLEDVLMELGAVQASSNHQSGGSSSSQVPPPSSMLPQHRAQQPPIPRPCRLLLCGEEDAGQRQVAGALLKLAQEVQVHTVSLPVLVAGGDGDATVGLVQLLQEALHRANSHTPLVLYLPSLEAWALETATLTGEEVEEGLGLSAGQAATGLTPQRNAQPSITPLKSYPASISPFRGLVSLQARQGASGGSRGGATSAPTPARKAVSTPARHLSFQQASSPDQMQPRRSGALPDGADPASPTLSLPSPHREDRAAGLSPRAVGADPRSPALSLPRPTPPRAAAQAPTPVPADPPSPTLSLPSPRGTRPAGSSPAEGSQLQPNVAMRLNGSMASGAAQFQSPPAVGQSRVEAPATGPLEEEEGQGVEVYILSQIWKVFEQVVKQIPSTQPLLILATCQRSPEALPPVLSSFFQSQSAAATAAGSNPGQFSPCLSSDTIGFDCKVQHHSSTSSSVIVMGTEVESEGSWQEAAHRTAEAAAQTVASAAAHSFQRQLLDKAITNHSTPALSNSRPNRPPAGAQAAQVASSSRAVHDPLISHNAANGLVGQRQLGQTGARQPTSEGQVLNFGKGHGAAINANDLQQGLKLHAEVQRHLKLCGQQLLNDRRIKCAQAPVSATRTDPGAVRADPSNSRADLSSSAHVASLAAIAQQAQRAQFESVEAFAEAVRGAVASVCIAVEGRMSRQNRHSKSGNTGYSVRAAAACALGDDVTLWCHAASQQLNLSDPASQRLLAAAQQHLSAQPRPGSVHSRQTVPTQAGHVAGQVAMQGPTMRASGLVTSRDGTSTVGDPSDANHVAIVNMDPGHTAAGANPCLDPRLVDDPRHATDGQLKGPDVDGHGVDAMDFELPQHEHDLSEDQLGTFLKQSTSDPAGGKSWQRQHASDSQKMPESQAASAEATARAEAQGMPGGALDLSGQLMTGSGTSLSRPDADTTVAATDLGPGGQPRSDEPGKEHARIVDDQIQAEAPDRHVVPAEDHAQNGRQHVSKTSQTEREEDTDDRRTVDENPSTSVARAEHNLQRQLRIRTASLRLQHKLQDSLSGAFRALLSSCTRSTQALQVCHSNMMAGVLERLPECADRVSRDFQMEEFISTQDTSFTDTCTQQFQDLLLSHVQAFKAK